MQTALKRDVAVFTTIERISLAALTLTAMGFISAIFIRCYLLAGDAAFRMFWIRNNEFVRARAAEQFATQMLELAKLPQSISFLTLATKEQTRALISMGDAQQRHGEELAELRTALAFVVPDNVDLASLRRRHARRAGDPKPSDLGELHELLSVKPDQSEDVAGHD